MKKALVCLLLVNVISVSSMDKKKNKGDVEINNPYFTELNEVLLTPVYNQPTTIAQQKKQPPLKDTSNIQLSLYNTVYKITLDTREGKMSKEQQAGRFIEVISAMNNAKNNSISENRMGTFAYNQSRSYSFMTQHIPLVFALLERYNYTVNHTKEELPSQIADYYNTKLSRIFGIQTPENNQTEPFMLECALKPYPAYVELTEKLNDLVNIPFNRNLNVLTDCLYKDENILFSGYSDSSYTNLLDAFYTKAFNLFYNKGSYVTLYEAILIINKAKKSGDIATETDLGSAILNFDPTKSSISKKIVKKLKTKDSIIKTKNRMALLCKLIEQYNNTDINKQRPTPRQYLCYEQQKDLNLILPTSNTSLDENHYAFAAFKTLVNDFITLGNSTDHQQIQLCVNKAYPNKPTDK